MSAWSFPTSTTYSSPASCDGVEREAEKDGYDLLIASSSEDPAVERRRVEALIARRIDGLIVVPARDDSMPSLKSGADGPRLPPTVLLDRGVDSAGFDTVRADCEAGGYAAARHLIGLGHRDIAILAHSEHYQNIAQRIAGCAPRPCAKPVSTGRERVVCGGHDLESLRGAIEIELHRADRPTAIFALTNICALASIKAARGLGLEIPGDVSIVGFDDFDWMFALRPYLTTVAQPVDDFASSSWGLLMRRLVGRRRRMSKRSNFPAPSRFGNPPGPPARGSKPSRRPIAKPKT